MDWWKKEQRYEELFASGRQAKDLWKYIPESLIEAIEETAIDSDGYWIYLNEGWNMDGERVIHTYTILDLKEDINDIVKDR